MTNPQLFADGKKSSDNMAIPSKSWISARTPIFNKYSYV